MRKAVLIDSHSYACELLRIPADCAAFPAWAVTQLKCRATEVGAYLPDGDCLYVDAEARFHSRHYFLHAHVGLPLPGSALFVPGRGSAFLEEVRSRVIFMDCYDAMEILGEWTPRSTVIPFQSAA